MRTHLVFRIPWKHDSEHARARYVFRAAPEGERISYQATVMLDGDSPGTLETRGTLSVRDYVSTVEVLEALLGAHGEAVQCAVPDGEVYLGTHPHERGREVASPEQASKAVGFLQTHLPGDVYRSLLSRAGLAGI